MAHVTIDLSEPQTVIQVGQTISELAAERALDSKKTAALARARKRHAEALEGVGTYALAKLRLQRGLSQTQLAHMMGVSQPYIAKIERGEDDLRASTIRKLAFALDVPAATVLALIEPKEGDGDE